MYFYSQRDSSGSRNFLRMIFSQVFCSKACYEDFKLLRSGSKIPPSGARCFCTVCAGMKQVEIQVIQDSDIILLCSDLCFKTYKFANNMDDIRKIILKSIWFYLNLSCYLKMGDLNSWCDLKCYFVLLYSTVDWLYSFLQVAVMFAINFSHLANLIRCYLTMMAFYSSSVAKFVTIYFCRRKGNSCRVVGVR